MKKINIINSLIIIFISLITLMAFMSCNVPEVDDSKNDITLQENELSASKGEWAPGVLYNVNDTVTYNGSTWRCTYTHTSHHGWYPGLPGLWFWEKTSGGGPTPAPTNTPWVQPTQTPWVNPTYTPTQTPIPSTPVPGNMLLNGDFSAQGQNWVTWIDRGAGANGSFDFSNGTCNATVHSGGRDLWSFIIFQDGMTMADGKTYVVSFQAKAQYNRSIRVIAGMNKSPWTIYGYSTINLSTYMQTYTFKFTMFNNTDSNAKLEFEFGTAAGNVEIDNVVVNEAAPTPTPSEPGTWYRARLTMFESYPDPNSPECLYYNGCLWSGYFAGLPGKMPESWVMANNIAAVHSKDFAKYNGKTLKLRKDGREIEVIVYDMCSDSDCGGCCSRNLAGDGYLIDLEKYTFQRFGVTDGIVEFTCLDCSY